MLQTAFSLIDCHLRHPHPVSTHKILISNWAFRCLVWVGLSGGDGAEVEFAAGQVDHGAEVAHVLESAGSGLDVLDDAVESFEDRVGV